MTLASCHCEVPKARHHVRQCSCALSCHCEAERSEAVAIARSLELNEITTSCATPRNDMCHRDVLAEGSQDNPPTLTLPLKGGREKFVSEAHSKELNVLKSYRLNDFKKKASATHVDMSGNIRHVAFTLAEVLITLAIIGVVAAMTIPTLITNYQEKQTVTQLTKIYSTLNNAYQMMQVEYGSYNNWGMTSNVAGQNPDGSYIYDHTSQKLFASRFKKFLKVAKTCELNKACDTYKYYSLSGDFLWESSIKEEDTGESPIEGRFFLNDGTYVSMASFNPTFSELFVVLPGAKDATLGKTRFYFYFDNKGFFPKGMKNDTKWPFDTTCIPDQATKKTMEGQGCTAWVIYNKNMDYLHCPDELSWDGKHKCSD